MPDEIKLCELALAKFLDRQHCILTGRGATALWMAYSLTDESRPKILLPAMVCASPMFTILHAGRIPVFIDVLESDATIDPKIVERTLEANPEIGAVLAVHLFGHPADIETLSLICEKFDVLLIEDVAQALGGIDSKKCLLGKHGDLSVVSFGHTKILDVGGGGAILTDDDQLASRIRYLNQNLPDTSPNVDRLTLLYRKLFYSIWECGQIEASFYQLFDLFPLLFRELYLYKISQEVVLRIEKALSQITDEVAHRRSLAELYKKELGSVDMVSFFQVTGLGVPWRFSFRVNASKRDDVLEGLWKRNLDASKWYPCISDWTPSGRSQNIGDFPVSKRLEKEVVNLWVSRDYSNLKGEKVIQTISEILGKRK
jgi:dTDP-4-amino-4,6-dideoxygalactose transaminase